MITPSGMTIAEYNAAIALENATHARVTFVMQNIVFQDEEFDFGSGIKVSSYMNPDTEMKFGTAFCKEAVVNFIRSEKTDNLNWSNEFRLEFGVENGNDIEWVTIGYFSGERPTWDRSNTIELLAYDRMIRFDKDADDFIKNISYPATLQDIYDALCTFTVTENVAGDEISSVMSHTYTDELEFPGGISCRELLSIIAKANGCYARVNNDGKVQMIWFRDHAADYSLDWDDCFDIQISNLQIKNKTQWKSLENMQWKDLENVKYQYYDNDYAENIRVKSLSFHWEAGEDSILITQPAAGTSSLWSQVKLGTWLSVKSNTWGVLRNDSSIEGNTYTIENNPLLYHSTETEIRNHLQSILNQVYSFSITYIAKVNAVGNWLIEAGDMILLEVERNEKFIRYPIFNMTISWNGACMNEYETTGSIRYEDVYL